MTTSSKYIILSAPSGAGKSTIAKHLLNSGLELEFSITACSRARRAGEVDGVDYYFISREEFLRRVKVGEFLEWEEVYKDHYYGTLKTEIERIEGKGHRVLFDVDVFGGLHLKRIFGEKALAIFISPPSIEVLRERLEKRATDSPDKIEIRLAKAEAEISKAPEFDVIVVNDHLETALRQTETTVRKFLYDV